ncbi:MAG: histidine phosphatase family protein [Bacteroidota bacterium]
MKTVYLVRHAKSDWSNTRLHDFDRPLNKRGKDNAPFMGKLLQQKGVLPDLLLSSPANRAFTTAQLIATEITYPLENIRTAPAIYEASPDKLLSIIGQQDNAYQALMLVGHNPGLTDLANQLAGLRIDNMPTCSIVGLTFDTDNWKNILQKKAQLIFFHYPKEFA